MVIKYPMVMKAQKRNGFSGMGNKKIRNMKMNRVVATINPH